MLIFFRCNLDKKPRTEMLQPKHLACKHSRPVVGSESHSNSVEQRMGTLCFWACILHGSAEVNSPLLFHSVTQMVEITMSFSICHRLRKDDPGFSIAGPYIDKTLPVHSIHSFVLKDTRFVSFFVIFSAHSQDVPSALLLTCARCDQPGCGPRRLSQGHHTY